MMRLFVAVDLNGIKKNWQLPGGSSLEPELTLLHAKTWHFTLKVIGEGMPESVAVKLKLPHVALARTGNPDPRLSAIISRHKNTSFGFMNVKTVKAQELCFGPAGLYSDIESFDMA